MKIKLKCVSYTDKRLEKDETFTYKWIPTLDKYRDLISLTVRDTKKEAPTNDFSLPTSPGDTMIIDFIHKEIQTDLKEEL